MKHRIHNKKQETCLSGRQARNKKQEKIVPCSMPACPVGRFHVPCYRAFSLLEMLIAMFIFVLIITVVVAIFGKMFSYNKNIRATETNMEEAGTAFELMAKTMRMSSLLQTANGHLTDTKIFMYNNSQKKCISYSFENSDLKMDSFTPANYNTECPIASKYISYSPLVSGTIVSGSGKFNVVPTDTTSPLVGEATITATVGGNQMETSVSFRDFTGVIQGY